MIVRNILPIEKEQYNQLVTHPVQSWEWGEFRMLCGVRVIRLGLFEGNELKEAVSATFHDIPSYLPILGGNKVLYMPRCTKPSKEMIEGIRKMAIENKVIFVKIEPDVFFEMEKINKKSKNEIDNWENDNSFVNGNPSFAPHSAVVDLSLGDEILLAKMKQKTRYNIKLAEKKGVEVVEDNSSIALEKYIELTKKTTQRQQFYAHSEDYHRQMWQVLHNAGIAKMLTARYQNEIITTWVLFIWHDTLYYPYGASSREYQDVMANNLMMWQSIQLGKKLGLKKFDLWGTLGPNAKENDSWYGFHKFKFGFGPSAIEYLKSKDFVIDPIRYKLFNEVNRIRKYALNTKSKMRSFF
mgnify:CR=1 FL=1